MNLMFDWKCRATVLIQFHGTINDIAEIHLYVGKQDRQEMMLPEANADDGCIIAGDANKSRDAECPETSLPNDVIFSFTTGIMESKLQVAAQTKEIVPVNDAQSDTLDSKDDSYVVPRKQAKRKRKNSGPEKERGDTNSRERWRQQHVNTAFSKLRRLLPSYPIDKKLSKQEILKRSIKYIKLLQGILDYFDQQEGDDESCHSQQAPCDKEAQSTTQCNRDETVSDRDSELDGDSDMDYETDC